MLKAEKKSQINYITRLEEIQLKLFPNESLQERFSNFSDYYIDYGDEFIERLKLELSPFQQNFHIFLSINFKISYLILFFNITFEYAT